MHHSGSSYVKLVIAACLCLVPGSFGYFSSVSSTAIPSTCSQACIGRDVFKNMTLNSIKQEILAKLGVTTDPRGASVPVSVRENLLKMYADAHYTQNRVHEGMQGDQAGDLGDLEYMFGAGLMSTEESSSQTSIPAKRKKVISYSSISTSAPAGVAHLPILSFDFGNTPMRCKVSKAELALYVRGTRQKNDSTSADAIPLVDIKIYKVTSEAPHLIALEEAATIKVPEQPGQWVTLDVTGLVSAWFAKPRHNLGIYVTAIDSGGANLIETDRGSFIEVFTTDKEKSRVKREAIGLDCKDTPEEMRCCRHPLTIDFEKFGWDFIIAPKKYEAFLCAGECPHAFLQERAHTHLLTQTTDKPLNAGPCCAPRKFSRISILYFDDNNNVMLDYLADMVVEACGCY